MFHFNSGNFQRIDGQPPLFLPPHLASLSSQFTPPLFSGMKGELMKVFSTIFDVMATKLYGWKSQQRTVLFAAVQTDRRKSSLSSTNQTLSARFFYSTTF